MRPPSGLRKEVEGLYQIKDIQMAEFAENIFRAI
jgi:hypothetical protein